MISSHRAIKATLLILSVFPLASALHAEEQPIQWREAFVTVKSDIQPVPGHENRALGLMKQRGFAFYSNGEVASVNVILTFERSEIGTQYKGYAVYSFHDDTTKVGRFEGHGDPVGEQTGVFTFEDGTGRYSGIRGNGTFTGTGFPPHGDIVLNVEGSYWRDGSDTKNGEESGGDS